MRKTILVLSALAAMATSAVAAPLTLQSPVCQQAVSLEACQAHVAYAAVVTPAPDTSPAYIKLLDPRYNISMRTAGGGGAGSE